MTKDEYWKMKYRPMNRCQACGVSTRDQTCCTGMMIFVSKDWHIDKSDENKPKLVWHAGRVYRNENKKMNKHERAKALNMTVREMCRKSQHTA